MTSIDHIKVGDKVKIVDNLIEQRNVNSQGLMNKWAGKIMTVFINSSSSLRMEEDKHYWCWYPNMIEKVINPLDDYEV